MLGVTTVDPLTKEPVMGVIPAPHAHTHELHGARFTSLATPSRGSSDTSVWLVEIDAETAGATHTLTREEVFVVLAGRAEVHLGAETSLAAAGDAIVVPAGVPFSLAPAGDEPLRALCCLPVGGQGRLGDGEPFTPPWAL
jgi:mannose-6-phosphate isomerase-like protein (cupin superfamily)